MKRAIALVVLMAITFGGGVVLASSVNGDFEGFPIIKMMVDGKEVIGDVPAINFKGRTMVPVRFVAEALGKKVTWNGDALIVTISDQVTTSTQIISESGVRLSQDVYEPILTQMEKATSNNAVAIKIPSAVRKNPGFVIEKDQKTTLTIEVTIVNISSEAIHVNPLYFTVVNSRGTATALSEETFTAKNYLHAIDLPPGAQTAGRLLFEIPVEEYAFGYFDYHLYFKAPYTSINKRFVAFGG